MVHQSTMPPINSDGTQWTTMWPRNNGEVQEMMAGPNKQWGCKWRTMVMEENAGEELMSVGTDKMAERMNGGREKVRDGKGWQWHDMIVEDGEGHAWLSCNSDGQWEGWCSGREMSQTMSYMAMALFQLALWHVCLYKAPATDSLHGYPVPMSNLTYCPFNPCLSLLKIFFFQYPANIIP